MHRPLLIYVSLALLSFILTGMALEPVAARDDSYKYLSNFSDSLDLVQKNYVDPVSLGRLMEGAYRGLLEELDPESFYLDPKELRRFREAADHPARATPGIDVSKRHGYAVVVAVTAGSPAAGKVATGDYIRTVDGSSTRPLNLFEIREKLEGLPGSKVELKVVRREDLETSVVTLERRPAERPTVVIHNLPAGVLHLVVADLEADSVQQTARALRAATAVNAVVLDLRGSSRGPLTEGARLADLFLDSGGLLRVFGKAGESVVRRSLAPLTPTRQIVSAPTPPPPRSAAVAAASPSATPMASVAGSSPSPRPQADPAPSGYEYRVAADPDDTAWRGRLLVLTDGGTAGAAEIAAAALRDAGRATLVGSRTFGRGGIQDLIPLEDGALHLTVARVVTPRGDSLLGAGLEPDEVVEKSREAAGDPVLDKAIELLQPDVQTKKAA